MSEDLNDSLFYITGDADQGFSVFNIATDNEIMSKATASVALDFFIYNDPYHPATELLTQFLYEAYDTDSVISKTDYSGSYVPTSWHTDAWLDALTGTPITSYSYTPSYQTSYHTEDDWAQYYPKQLEFNFSKADDYDDSNDSYGIDYDCYESMLENSHGRCDEGGVLPPLYGSDHTDNDYLGAITDKEINDASNSDSDRWASLAAEVDKAAQWSANLSRIELEVSVHNDDSLDDLPEWPPTKTKD